jgi:hypothetical protein
VSGL